MQKATQFVFGGDEYKIVQAQIYASIGDPYWCDTYNQGEGKAISWSISFETETENIEPESESDEDELLPPNVDFDGIPVEINNWHELVGYQAKWKEPINKATGERYGMVYVYDHQLISNGRVRITGRDGTKFQVVASGQNETGERFQIDAPAEFTGIYVNGSEYDTNDSIRARVAKYIDDSNLRGTSFKLEGKYQSGVRMGSCFFSPTPVPPENARSSSKAD